MKADNLRFKWDPHANRECAGETKKKKKQDEMKSLEEYFDFIEQFTCSGDGDIFEQHVDKKFTLVL
ncbi:MAG: hypothetical protein JW863_22770 [Chitinispirillaceae bacterium]|nr:hypothetical protein [Chitinispirillaceae bacterium]